MRSVIIPCLADFLKENSQVICEFQSYEISELPNVLKSAKADLIILDHHLSKQGFVEHSLGQEEYVVIESAKLKTPTDLYLDHGPNDSATEDFFNTQTNAPKNYRRSFMGDVYGIIDGVELGLGRAVMSKNLIINNKKIKQVKGFKTYTKDITINYFEQPFYSLLHKKICENSFRYL